MLFAGGVISQRSVRNWQSSKPTGPIEAVYDPRPMDGDFYDLGWAGKRTAFMGDASWAGETKGLDTGYGGLRATRLFGLAWDSTRVATPTASVDNPLNRSNSVRPWYTRARKMQLQRSALDPRPVISSFHTYSCYDIIKHTHTKIFPIS